MNENKRDTNMEILRILAMVMVVGLHCIGNSAILEKDVLSPINDFLCRYLKLLCNVANGLFLLITGYYCVNKGFKLKKIVNLWGRTIFYSISILLIVLPIAISTNSVMHIDIFSGIFPILSGKHWFITAYIILCFIYPFYNLLLKQLDRDKWKTLITILFICSIVKFVFIPSGIFGQLILVLMFYTIGGYIRNFVEIDRNKKYLSKYFIIGIIGALVGLVIFKLYVSGINFGNVKILIRNINANFYDFVNPVSTIMAIYLFLKFRTMDIKNVELKKLVSFIGPSIFSVYIIHENINLRSFWRYLPIDEILKTAFAIPYILCLIITVFCICIVIDLIRRLLYECMKKIPTIRKMIDKINFEIDVLDKRINLQ